MVHLTFISTKLLQDSNGFAQKSVFHQQLALPSALLLELEEGGGRGWNAGGITPSHPFPARPGSVN